MARLLFNRDGKALYDFLLSAAKEAGDRVIRDDNPHQVRMFQGECRALCSLIDFLKPVSS